MCMFGVCRGFNVCICQCRRQLRCNSDRAVISEHTLPVVIYSPIIL